jgi:hypothetical protein
MLTHRNEWLAESFSRPVDWFFVLRFPSEESENNSSEGVLADTISKAIDQNFNTPKVSRSIPLAVGFYP